MNERMLKMVEEIREQYKHIDLYSDAVRYIEVEFNPDNVSIVEQTPSTEDGEVTKKYFVKLYVGNIAGKLTIPQFVKLLDDWMNWISVNETRRGLSAGIYATRLHRTIQRSIIGLLFAMIYGLSLGGTDARNETAIKSCRKIAELMDEYELSIGAFI